MTDQIHLVNVQMGQTHRVINVQTDQILLVDVLIYVTLNFVLFVMPFLANV